MQTPCPYPGPLYDASNVRKLRCHVVASVRGRVPSIDAEDVVQTAMCDALAAQAVPADELNVVRWLKGIARHKVADYHRTSRRVRGADGDELGTEPASFEARSLLRWVMRQVGARASDTETFSWLVREAAGERLDHLAREAGLPAEVVRQRVSRLRRSLRSRWLAELALAGTVLLIGSAALQGTLLGSPRQPRIVADAPALGGDSSSDRLSALQGRWKVISMNPAAGLDPARAALVAAAPTWVEVLIEGRVLQVVSPSHASVRSLSVDSADDDTLRVSLRGGPGGREQARVRKVGVGRLEVTADEGPWRGRAVLERRE